MLARWFSTVRGLRPSPSAISLLVLSEAINFRMRCSAGVRLSRPGFSITQSGGARSAVYNQSGNRRADVVLARGHGVNALQDVCGRAFLEHIAFRAEIHGFVKHVFLAIHGDENNLERESLVLARARDFQAAAAGHVHVEDKHIRLQFARKAQRFRAIAGFLPRFSALDRIADDLAQPVAVNRMVIRH